MKRTGFKRKPNKEKKPTKGLFADYKPTKRNSFKHLKKETKTDEWNRIKREIRPFFKANGLYDICELRIPNICIGSVLDLQFAHSKKREDISKEEPERTRELKEVVRACTACHHFIEYPERTEEETGRQIMYRMVIECIARRNKRLDLWTKIS